MKQKAAKGHTKKHAHGQAKKHAAAGGKHHPKVQPGGPIAHHPKTQVAGKHPHHAKARQLSPGHVVACCSATALAASLRLSGRSVGADDVFALYRRTAADPDAGASVLATLEAASEFGLAGVRPSMFSSTQARGTSAPSAGGSAYSLSILRSPSRIVSSWLVMGVSVILGLDLPEGPHAVTVGPDGRWWSWDEPWDAADFSDAIVEEAWAVTWP